MILKMKNIYSIIFLCLLSINCFSQILEYDRLVNEGLELLMKQNNTEAAIKYIKALNMDSTRVEAIYGLGVAYLFDCENKGVNCNNSLFFLDKAIKIDNTYRNGYYNRARCKVFLQNFEGALEDYAKAIQNNSSIPDSYYSMALIYQRFGDKDNACKYFKKAAELNFTAAKNMLIYEGCK